MARLRPERPGGIGGGKALRKALTGRQTQILAYLRQHVLERGYPPSVREIGESVGLRSSSTVHGYLARLEQKGYIRRDPTKPRAIELLDRDEAGTVLVPLVGRVTAGQPVLAEANVERLFPLPRDLAYGDELFMLRVRGDSMTEAGILDGDLVVVRRQAEAADGDIVVALLGDEATVKRFHRDRNGVRTRDVSILGKVTGLFRRF